jgi:hypothetical protein
LWGFGPKPSPPCVSRTHNPTTAAAAADLYAPPPPHPYATSSIAVSHGVPETEPRWLGFVFLAQTPPPASHFMNAPPHHHHHLVRITIPPLHTVLHRRFARRTRNRATMASFRVFSSDPIPRLAFHKRTTPPPPLPRTHHHPTPMQRSPSPFHTARRKSSLISAVFDSAPQTGPHGSVLYLFLFCLITLYKC